MHSNLYGKNKFTSVKNNAIPIEPFNEKSSTYELWKNIIAENEKFKKTKVAIKQTLNETDYSINNQIFNKNSILGQGSYGKIFKVLNEDNQEQYACKCQSRQVLNKVVQLNGKIHKQNSVAQKEILAAELLYSEFIVNGIEVIDDLNHDHVYLILELCDSDIVIYDPECITQDNSKFIKQSTPNFFQSMFNNSDLKLINEDQLRIQIYEIARGVQFIHQLNMAHCDIKPQNIMLKSGKVKIGDFGSLIQLTDERTIENNGLEGTPFFFPPEHTDESSVDLSLQLQDIWALGVTCFCMAFGLLPFDLTNTLDDQKPQDYNIIWDIIESKYEFSKKFKQFICYLMNHDPKKRPDINQVLLHSFLNPKDTVTSMYLCQCSEQKDERDKLESSFFQVSNRYKDKFHRKTVKKFDNIYKTSLKLPKTLNDTSQNESEEDGQEPIVLTSKQVTMAELSNQTNNGLMLTISDANSKKIFKSASDNDRQKNNLVRSRLSDLFSENFDNKLLKLRRVLLDITETISEKQNLDRTIMNDNKYRMSDSQLLQQKELNNKQNKKTTQLYTCLQNTQNLELEDADELMESFDVDQFD